LASAAEAPQRTGGAGRTAIAIAGSLALLASAYLVIRVAASGLSPTTGIASAGMPPRDYAPGLKLAVKLLQVPQQKVTNDMLQLARDGLNTSPLAFEPFFIAARGEEQIGRLDRAIADMEEARRRRPTYSAIRMQLLAYYTRTNRYEPALTELDLLLRRNPDLRRPLLPQIVKLTAVEEGRAALASLLSKDPEWGREFFAVAADQKVAPQDARRLYEAIRAKKGGRDLSLERGLVFLSLAAAGNYHAARDEWLSAFPPAERARHALLFDGAFSGRAAPRPFGWLLIDGEAGRAEIARDGTRSYLDVSYFGVSDLVLAEQTLALSPGRYTIRAVASASEPVERERLFWRVSCLPKQQDLARLDLGGVRQDASSLAATFSVPANCPGQRLALIGNAGERSGVTAVRVERLEIVQ
jgi:tetratricopeptide (TPR) repeat protein